MLGERDKQLKKKERQTLVLRGAKGKFWWREMNNPKKKSLTCRDTYIEGDTQRVNNGAWCLVLSETGLDQGKSKMRK